MYNVQVKYFVLEDKMKFWFFTVLAVAALINAIIGTEWVILPISSGWPTTAVFLLTSILCGLIAWQARKQK
jgi:hypothetical protein